MTRKTNYYELTEQEKGMYHNAIIQIILQNEATKRLMTGTTVNNFALELVNAVNLTIEHNAPIDNLEKEMD